jgi:hypothetical protein
MTDQVPGGQPQVPPADLSDLDRLLLEFDNLNRIDDAVDRADNKSAVIATANVGLLTILLGLGALVSAPENPPFDRTQTIIIFILFVLHFIPAVASTFFAMQALFPRLSPGSRSTVYFGGIAALGSVEAAVQRLSVLDYQQTLYDLLEQIYLNSRIAQRKFEHLRWSIALLYFSGALWMLLMVLLFIFLIANASTL